MRCTVNRKFYCSIVYIFSTQFTIYIYKINVIVYSQDQLNHLKWIMMVDANEGQLADRF